ncbi:MAG TPA: hypothetical protein VMV14_06390 [Acidimicrobiales bacterium]|nr:hypothetical protein [Acidimicrobiales bacterium]
MLAEGHDAGHGADRDPTPLDRDPTPLDTGVLDELESVLHDVERALARLDDGSYGTCEACGAGLDPAELEQQPSARYCRAHLPLRTS